jgi:enamine deaminase RidA (YjgF/YER057c/UK114 family)
MSAEERLKQLGLELPPPIKPAGLYAPLVVVGNLAYSSGHVSLKPDGTVLPGKVGDTMTVEEGKAAARSAGLAILGTVRNTLGSLDRVRRVVKVLGLVNATPDFEKHPLVINGCSELFAELFGRELGIGARSAVGAGSLPLGAAVEVEAIFEIEPGQAP